MYLSKPIHIPSRPRKLNWMNFSPNTTFHGRPKFRHLKKIFFKQENRLETVKIEYNN